MCEISLLNSNQKSLAFALARSNGIGGSPALAVLRKHVWTIFVDACVACAHSGYEPRQRLRADRDGAAAADAVRGKRARYPPSGGELVPLIFEAGGRPAEETVAFVRSWGLEMDSAERSKVIRYAWQ